MPEAGSPYINISGLSGRSLQRVRLLPNRQRLASNYGKTGSEMDWAGDAMMPASQPATPAASENSMPSQEGKVAGSVHYDDGYGPLPPPPPSPVAPKPDTPAQAKSLADDDSGGNEDATRGINGPIPDADTTTQSLARSLAIAPEYPGASRFVPANSGNFRAVKDTRTIKRIVIHITDGQSKLNGTVGWFQDPSAKVSAHYVVGQDGEVVQMVMNNDIAWHASSANGDSIGIEHVARSPHEWDKKLGHTDPGMMPTEQQYCSSAALVNWLCNQFNLPMDRTHILGHSEADPKTTHTDCPNAVWDWEYYMGLVTSNSCTTETTTASSLSFPPASPRPKRMGPVRVRTMEADLQPAHLPAATRLSGPAKIVVRTAIDAVLAAPMTPALPALVRIVNDQGFSVGLGLGGDAGLLGGAGLGFGIILAPNNDIGVFGNLEIRQGLLAGISADARVVVLRGGIDAFNEIGYVAGVTLEPEVLGVGIPGEATVIALFDSQRQFHGVSFRLGLGEALSPIQIFTATENSASVTLTQSLGTQASAGEDDSLHGIEGPVPDEVSAAQSLALSPEYPRASRFEPADSANFHALSQPRTINRVVIHITDGGSKINGTVGWFKNPVAKVSAHYVIGQDGEVVQMVRHNDVAWHASSANGDSIGIEHVANTRGLKPTPAQYCASAALVSWLASQFGLPTDRTHVLGHSEADPKTSHTACPNAVWDWDYYMGMVTSQTCYEPQTQSLSVKLPPAPRKLPGGRSLAAAPDRMVGNSAVQTVVGGEGNITWELDQFPGVKIASANTAAPLQSAETIELSNWPYCDHTHGGRASAWFDVDWKFSGQTLGQVRITPAGSQQGSQPLRVEARIEDGMSRDNLASLLVRFTYHFATAEGPEIVALTELRLYSDGSIDQNSKWTSQLAA